MKLYSTRSQLRFVCVSVCTRRKRINILFFIHFHICFSYFGFPHSFFSLSRFSLFNPSVEFKLNSIKCCFPFQLAQKMCCILLFNWSMVDIVSKCETNHQKKELPNRNGCSIGFFHNLNDGRMVELKRFNYRFNCSLSQRTTITTQIFFSTFELKTHKILTLVHPQCVDQY